VQNRGRVLLEPDGVIPLKMLPHIGLAAVRRCCLYGVRDKYLTASVFTPSVLWHHTGEAVCIVGVSVDVLGVAGVFAKGPREENIS